MAAMEPLEEDVFSSGNLCSDNGTFSPGPVSAVYLRAKFCWLMGAHGLGPVAWLQNMVPIFFHSVQMDHRRIALNQTWAGLFLNIYN